MRRAQIAGQIFIYAITLVIVAAILIFGYNAIKEMNESQDTIEALKLREDLQSTLGRITSQYGSFEKASIPASNLVKEVCFLNNHDPSRPNGFNQNEDMRMVLADYPFIFDTLGSNGEPTVNIFVIDLDGIILEQYLIGNTALDDTNFACFDVERSHLSFNIAGRGDHVFIS